MYAIIGAGPMGLASARNLQKLGIPFIGFEQHSDVGGLWDIDNPHSTMYDSAHLISSKRMTEFAEFPMDDSVAPYPHHSEMRRYFHDYASHFQLRRHYEFNTRVIELTPDGDGWMLLSERDGVQQRRRFDGVLIANGTLHKPNIPGLPGQFSGELMHSADYRSPEVFKGKRVLLVGCGNSGADIAVDAVHHAASVDISLRRGYYFLPKFVRGRPIDTLGGKRRLPRPLKQRIDAAMIRMILGKPSDYGLPDPDYRMYESHPVVNSLILHHLGHGDITPRRDIAAIDGHRVRFADGASAEYDLILQATGYQLDYPFIERRHLNWPESEDAPQLYMNIFHPQYDNLFMMGMIEATGLGWEGRNQQARLVALYLHHRQAGSQAVAALDQARQNRAGERLDGGYRYIKLARMAYYVNKEVYLAALHRHIAELEQALPAAPADLVVSQ
ncbi:Predicted flavoprotein CzcO associated with the cation diffusion facilitator CzcD [Halopseudomonas formosensis]|uniref:Predicted flavoprotein CzcO associated with the cation diffusion facilitator CzcD n=1 Tax=Halopseudomonas formosensis TaxID=1002526 RepID=A0A1I5ZNJ8_9GAMM|nr:NAD(P)-binding domain-containing protein [Halopseudomonas formosensis]NLC00835.1 NAD(P)-binding domain-containing protein [Halopseudomonas formosensis]SFQ58059.1 Predicted flavoprotein CzcO associated with the cation diffusion facilitator CzcD [Halopseudomonas formosensis]